MTFHMRAVVVREYGGRAEIVELPAPEVEPGHILIKIAAAGMNPMDRSIAGGAWKPVMAATFPMILGFDVAGIVGDIGEGTTRFGVGESVIGQLLLPPVLYSSQVGCHRSTMCRKVQKQQSPETGCA